MKNPADHPKKMSGIRRAGRGNNSQEVWKGRLGGKVTSENKILLVQIGFGGGEVQE